MILICCEKYIFFLIPEKHNDVEEASQTIYHIF